MIEFNKEQRALAKVNAPKTPKGYRVPADATPEQIAVADFAFERLIAAAAGRVNPLKAPTIIKAAVELRKETCGPIAIKVEQDIGGRLEKLLTQSLEEPPKIVDAVAVQTLPEKTTGQAPDGAQPAVPTLLGS